MLGLTPSQSLSLMAEPDDISSYLPACDANHHHRHYSTHCNAMHRNSVLSRIVVGGSHIIRLGTTSEAAYHHRRGDYADGERAQCDAT